jgi:hypothetical protein
MGQMKGRTDESIGEMSDWMDDEWPWRQGILDKRILVGIGAGRGSHFGRWGGVAEPRERRNENRQQTTLSNVYLINSQQPRFLPKQDSIDI